MENTTPAASPITGHTGLICLLGSPCAHSVSPMMHNASLRLLGSTTATSHLMSMRRHFPPQLPV